MLSNLYFILKIIYKLILLLFVSQAGLIAFNIITLFIKHYKSITHFGRKKNNVSKALYKKKNQFFVFERSDS